MNYSELRAAIARSGIKKSALAERVGIGRTSLWKKCTGKTQFTSDEMRKLADTLRLSPEEIQLIFFSDEVN